MGKQFFIAAAFLTLAACSAPTYTYNFDHYDYSSGKKLPTQNSVAHDVPNETVSPLTFSNKELLASASPTVVVPEEIKTSSFSQEEKADRYKNMSKRERTDFKKELRSEIKNYAKKLKSGDEGASIAATNELDDELKLAIIFGAIGITLTVLGGINTVFWVLGVVGLVIGLVFFIRWISRQ